MMFYGNTIQDTRSVFFTSWNKYRQKLPLLPLEQQIVDVILIHPEYHALLDRPSCYQDRAYPPEMGLMNPFLHMGLHLAVRDQIRTNRPIGITDVYQQLVNKLTDQFSVEHLIMEHLAEFLWQAQHNQDVPNEAEYLKTLTHLLKNRK